MPRIIADKPSFTTSIELLVRHPFLHEDVIIYAPSRIININHRLRTVEFSDVDDGWTLRLATTAYQLCDCLTLHFGLPTMVCQLRNLLGTASNIIYI